MNGPPGEPVRGFTFWALAPFLILFVALMPFLARPVGAYGFALLCAVEILAVLVFLGLFHSIRFGWAWRAVGAILFGFACGYLIEMLAKNGGRIGMPGRRSTPSVINAMIFLVVVGLPALWFALFGRLTFRRETYNDDADGDSPDDDNLPDDEDDETDFNPTMRNN